MFDLTKGKTRACTFARVVLPAVFGLCLAPVLKADNLSGSVAEYRKTGRVAAFAEARKHAAGLLSAQNAEPSPSELASLLELSRYVGAVERDRYLEFAVKRLPSRSGSGSKAFAAAFKQLDSIRRTESDIADVCTKLPARALLPGADRAGWAKLAGHPSAGSVIENAERLLGEPITDTSDELYVQFWEIGNRRNYELVYFPRIVRLVTLTVAESLERKGRFMPALVEIIDAICSMKSWVLPAHDWTDVRRGNLRGTVIGVDLFSSQIASHLAYTVNFLGDALPAETVRKIRAETDRRIFAPVRFSYEWGDDTDPSVHRRDPMRNLKWIYGGNNWNAVCHDNMVTAALGLLDDVRDRAFFTVRALRGLKRYEKSGFDSDGYCSEGMGYWNYGYGHLLMLGLTLRDVTDGKIDLFTAPVYRKAAEYAYGYQLERGVSPAFSDGNGAPSAANLALVRRVWPDLTGRAAEDVSPFGIQADGVAGIYSDHYAALLGFGKVAPPSSAPDMDLPLRSEFPVGQVWLMRDGKDLSVAVKGGHNGEHHNHNDVGSYYLVSDGKLLSGDPGRERYTSRTFSKDRYKAKVLSSYGHPVPVVDGKLQSAGRSFAAKVLKTEFTDAMDTVVLDISGAYDVKHLVSLVRTFTLDRVKKTFTVTDAVKFSKPSGFEDAYTTFEGEEFGLPFVYVRATKGGTVHRSSEHIENPLAIAPVRHSVKFAQPVTEAEVSFVFSVDTLRSQKATSDIDVEWLFRGDRRTAYRDPAAGWADGVCHLFFTMIETDDDGRVYSHVATSQSKDLKNWSAVRMLTPRSDRDYSSPGNLVKDGDDWVLCFQSYPRPGNRDDGVVRYADKTARLFTMRTRDFKTWSEPELLRVKGSDVPESEMGRMIDPYLVRLPSGGWMCFYKQRGASFSRSPDLKEWTFAGRTEAGENVCIVQEDGAYWMIHSPRSGMRLKRSEDLMKWTDVPGFISLGQSRWPWARGRITAGFLLDCSRVPGKEKWGLFFHASGPLTESEGDFDRNASIGIAFSPALNGFFDKGSVQPAEEPLECIPAARVAHIAPRRNRDKGIFGEYWWANRFLKKHNQIKALAGKPVDVVFLGDSITAILESGKSEVWKKLTSDRTVLNFGYGGDSTQHLLWRIEHGELDGYEAKCVVLLIGTNNNTRDSTKPENVARAIKKIVSRIREKQPKAKLVLHPILPRGNSAKSRRHAAAHARNVKTNALLKRFVDSDGKIIWIDFNDKLVDASGWVPKSIMPDQIHPSIEGYRIWMEALEPVLGSR